MATLPIWRRPFPPIDPVDPCFSISTQLRFIDDAFKYIGDLLGTGGGSAFVVHRGKLADEQITLTLQSFAMNWSGIIPPIVPLICRSNYAHIMSRRRDGWRMLQVHLKRADRFVGGKFVVDGFVSNRPHERRLVLQQMSLGT